MPNSPSNLVFGVFSRCLIASLLAIGFWIPSSNAADDSWINRFLPQVPVATPAPDLRLPDLPPAPAKATNSDAHNRGVQLSNEAIDLLKENRPDEALRNLAEAMRCDPGELAFLNNYTLALKQAKRPAEEILEAYRLQLAIDRKREQAALGAGLVLYESMKNARDALPYLSLAHSLKPDDSQLATTFATILAKAGHTAQALDLLNRYAYKITDSAYPMYLLGNLLQDKEDLVAALRAFENATRFDKEGFAFDALIRAKYFAGQHDGLADLCRRTLSRFPKILNRESLQRILFSLEPHRLRLLEQITLDLADPSTVLEMELLVRHPPSRLGHQDVRLESAEWVSGGRRFPVKPGKTDATGRESFQMPSEALGKRTTLKLSYLIQVQPWLVSRGPFAPVVQPDLGKLKADPALDLNEPRLVQLDNRLKQLPGHPIQTIFLAVARGLRYQENFKDHPISWIFDNLEGCDCTEYAKLLTALCLRRNIPARMVNGFLLKTELLGRETNIGHAWAEIFLAEKGWVPADPTLGNNMHRAYFGNQLSDQVFFDILEPDRPARISLIQKTSAASDAGLNISSSFHVTLLP